MIWAFFDLYSLDLVNCNRQNFCFNKLYITATNVSVSEIFFFFNCSVEVAVSIFLHILSTTFFLMNTFSNPLAR